MKKRGARIRHTARGHILTPNQIKKLTLPIHVALELLPLGLYTEDHAHDLAAFLNIASAAAAEAGNENVKRSVIDAMAVVEQMQERVRAGKGWNVTADERDQLTRAIMVIDTWQRTQTTARWKRAIYRVLDALDKVEESYA